MIIILDTIYVCLSGSASVHHKSDLPDIQGSLEPVTKYYLREGRGNPKVNQNKQVQAKIVHALKNKTTMFQS